MMQYNPHKVFKGIVLQKTAFRESSLICNVLTSDFGKISLLAKGIKKPANPNYGLLQVLSELELSVYNNKSSDWYILRSAQFLQDFNTSNYETSVVQQAGAEIFSQLVIPDNEAENSYQTLYNYLNYTKKIEKNAIALFWRLLFTLFKSNGIFPDLNYCSNCHKKMNTPAGYFLSKAGFICFQCQKVLPEKSLIELNEEEIFLLNKIPSIGNHLSELKISSETAKHLSYLLIRHLNLHFNNHFHIKSLKVLFPNEV